MLALLFAASAFVCPPIEESTVLKAVGEPCGGTCDTFGLCAEGLTCQVPKTASPFSFAILQGAKKAGKCVNTLSEVEDRGRRMPGATMGGNSDADIADPDVLAASKFGMVQMNMASNSLTPPKMDHLISAQKQVRERASACLTPRAPRPTIFFPIRAAPSCTRAISPPHTACCSHNTHLCSSRLPGCRGHEVHDHRRDGRRRAPPLPDPRPAVDDAALHDARQRHCRLERRLPLASSGM